MVNPLVPKIILSTILVLCIQPFAISEQDSNSYLGQKPPGMVAEVFGPGIISTPEYMEASLSVTPDGKEIYFVRGKSFRDQPSIYVIKNANGEWTDPQTASFSGVHYDFESQLSPDGKKMFFMRFNPKDETVTKGIWTVERIGDVWGPEKFFRTGSFATSTLEGSVYFTHTKDKRRDIAFTRLVNGDYTEPVFLGGGVSRPSPGGQPVISPDESFVIFGRKDKEQGHHDLFVSFRLEDGTWSESINFGKMLNSAHKNCASLSPDGKYLFYTHFVTASDSDVYWVSTEVIHTLRTKNRSSNSGPKS